MRTLTTRNFFDEAFDSFFSPVYKVNRIAMKTDILEKDDHFELAIDLAGFKKEELSINLDKGILTISATKQESQAEGEYLCRERISSCSRNYRVGNVAKDAIKANFTDGVLYVNIPKEQEKLDTQISIS